MCPLACSSQHHSLLMTPPYPFQELYNTLQVSKFQNIEGISSEMIFPYCFAKKERMFSKRCSTNVILENKDSSNFHWEDNQSNNVMNANIAHNY